MPAPDDLRRPSSTARIRVLLTIKGLGPGGAERLLADVVATGNVEDFDYEVAYVLDGEDALAPAIIAGGTPVHALGSTRNLDLRWMAAFRRLLLDGNFDIVHFHLPYTAALGRLVVATLPRGKRPVTIYTEHSMWNKVAVLVKMLNRSTIASDRALLAVSDAAYDALPRSLQPRARI
ncbi:MAG TPA: glycosyltransferase, partial [Acidimicrobiales bacterium]|nr:glycosyltransferase [Acidimicrobiales bacterium]